MPVTSPQGSGLRENSESSVDSTSEEVIVSVILITLLLINALASLLERLTTFGG